MVGKPVLWAIFVFKPLIPTARFSENDNPFMVIKFKFIFQPAKLLLFFDIFMVLFGPFSSRVCTFSRIAVLLQRFSSKRTCIKSTNGSCSCSVVLGKPVNTNKKRPCNARTFARFVLRYLHVMKFPRFQSRVEQKANALLKCLANFHCDAKVHKKNDICKSTCHFLSFLSRFLYFIASLYL